MNTPSPWLRPLQVLATTLAFAIALLATLLVQREPAPPVAPLEPSADGTPDPVAAVAAYESSGLRSASPPSTAGTSAVDPTPARTPTATLYGTLRTADGALVEQALLWLTGGAGGSTTSGSFQAGVFAFAALQPGSYELSTRIDDQLPLRRTIEVIAPRTRLDLQLDARWLLTVNAVTADGTPLLEAAHMSPVSRGVTVTANAFAAPLVGDLPASGLSTVEAGIGTFRGNDFFRRAALPKQVVGVLTLPTCEPVHVALLLRSTVVAQQAVPTGQAEVTFTLPAEALTGKFATVRLRCVDEAGQPVVGARVALSDRQTGSVGQPTGDDGRITVSNLVPGRLGLDFRHQDLCAPWIEIDVPPGADLDLGDVLVRPAVKMPISLEGLGKQARLSWTMLDALPRVDWHQRDGWYSADNGATRTLSLFPGRYAFYARGDGGAAITEVDVRVAPAEPLRFRLAPAAQLRLVNEVRGGFARVRITTASGAQVDDRDWTGTWTRTMQLPPGSYLVEVTDLTNHTTRRPLQLGPEGGELRVP